MPETLQHLVDELALRIGRPVLLEDHEQRVLAYSEQDGPMDDIRRESILRRHTTAEVRDRYRAAGILAARGPLRIPGAAGALDRVCVPARHRERLLGFVWLIDAGPPMSDEDVAIAAKTAPALALTLFHDSLAAGLTSRREAEAVSAVLLGDRAAAREGARLLVEAGGFAGDEPVTALVVRPVPASVALADGLLAARARLACRPLHLVRGDHGVLLCPGRPPDPVEVGTLTGVPAVVGAGGPRALADAAESYREALHAAEVALRVPGYGPAASWSSLGVYRMLSTAPSALPAQLHPGLERLLADPASRSLVETLETYLDLAGSVVATARTLRLHRTSLYYRLQRVEQLAGTDLHDGDERLMLHLSLKMARLTGRLTGGSRGTARGCSGTPIRSTGPS
ncbi:MAG TPA: helix-turn-helix domain-containing protein [Actinophytocola sp.]|uniref:PucR family transcriptional regulator n=1 Tax=Actinophytocola sp. TaxID=1872138 RepID=UPI002F95054E